MTAKKFKYFQGFPGLVRALKDKYDRKPSSMANQMSIKKLKAKPVALLNNTLSNFIKGKA